MMIVHYLYFAIMSYVARGTPQGSYFFFDKTLGVPIDVNVDGVTSFTTRVATDDLKECSSIILTAVILVT